MVLCEIFIAALHPEMMQSENWLQSYSLSDQIIICTPYLLLYVILLLLTARLFTYKTSRLSGKEWLLYTIFPASQALMVSLWWFANSREDPLVSAVLQAVSVLICILADIALFLAVRGMSQRAELKAQNQLLADQIDLQREHYAALTEQYERIRVMRHDIANHMHTVQILLNQGNAQAAEAYAAEMLEQHRFHSSLGECENPIVDAFVFSRVEATKIQDIAFSAEVRLPREPGIADTALITAFGNLLDNAVEACLQLPPEQRFIRLSAGMRGAFLAIRVENSGPQTSTTPRLERIPGLERGLGIHILRDLAEQYHGAFQTSYENGCYVAVLTLQAEGCAS